MWCAEFLIRYYSTCNYSSTTYSLIQRLSFSIYLSFGVIIIIIIFTHVCWCIYYCYQIMNNLLLLFLRMMVAIITQRTLLYAAVQGVRRVGNALFWRGGGGKVHQACALVSAYITRHVSSKIWLQPVKMEFGWKGKRLMHVWWEIWQN